MIWKIIANVKVFADKCKQDHIDAFAAQSAFFILLSAIPLLMVFSSLLQYTPVTENMVLKLVSHAMPDYLAPFCVTIINEVYHKSFGIVSVAAVAAVWSAAKGMQYLANGLNAVNNLQETRNWLALRFRAVIYTVVFVLAIVATLVLLVFGTSLQQMILKYIPFMVHVTDLIMRLRILILLGILILFFTVIFKTLPNRKTTLFSQVPGAILCALSWYLFSLGLSAYVQFFHGFSMYGSLTTIVLMMLWLYFCMYILMACAEVNVVFEDAIRSFNERKKAEKQLDVSDKL